MLTKIMNLAEKITRKTENNEVNWSEEDNILSEEFFARIGNIPVAILSHTNNDTGTHSFIFKVYSSAAGQLAGQVSRDDHEDGYSILGRLFESAMASARNLDHILEEMQSALGDLEENV